MGEPRRDRWLPLGEAASELGVDEATLRHWADAGQIRTFRTPGGHRRFLERDLRALMQREVPRVEDLADLVERRVKKLLSRAPARPLHDRTWFSALNEELRAKARDHGRDLVSSVARFVAFPQSRDAIRAELRARALAYGIELKREGVVMTQAAEAFAFFRHLLLDLVTRPRGRGGMLDENQVGALVEVSDLLDEVFLEVMRAWEDPVGTARGALEGTPG